MLDQDKSKQELIEELAEMRRREAQSRSVAAERDRDRAILAAAIDCLPFEFFAIGTDGRYMLQNGSADDMPGMLSADAPKTVPPTNTLVSCGSTTTGGPLLANEWKGKSKHT